MTRRLVLPAFVLGAAAIAATAPLRAQAPAPAAPSAAQAPAPALDPARQVNPDDIRAAQASRRRSDPRIRS